MIIRRFRLPFFPNHIRKRLFFLDRCYNLMRIVIVLLDNQRRMRIFIDDMPIYVSPAGVLGFAFKTPHIAFWNEMHLFRFTKQLLTGGTPCSASSFTPTGGVEPIPEVFP